tara:strand:- start:94 stop:246 length:153 start_codon:yes stop_codon:yes gene_type:complete
MQENMVSEQIFLKIKAFNLKKRLHKAGAKLLRQVSYRQETYRAVRSLYPK